MDPTAAWPDSILYAKAAQLPGLGAGAIKTMPNMIPTINCLIVFIDPRANKLFAKKATELNLCSKKL